MACSTRACIARRLAIIALAASFSAQAAEPHNLVLLVPHVLPAASAQSGTAPTLHHASVESQLHDLGLYETTNIIVAAEHTVSTVWKATRTSFSVELDDEGHQKGPIPPGFLAVDLAVDLQETNPKWILFDRDDANAELYPLAGSHPRRGNAIIASNPADPDVEIEANGGYDFIYLSSHFPRRELVRLGELIVDTLLSHDYTGGVFVNEMRLGRIPGALAMKHIGLERAVSGRLPDIVVGFVSTTMDASA